MGSRSDTGQKMGLMENVSTCQSEKSQDLWRVLLNTKNRCIVHP